MSLPDRNKFPVVLEGYAFSKEGYIIHECALIQSQLQEEIFMDKFRNTNPKITIKQFPFVLEAWDEVATKKILVDRQTMENDGHLKRFISKYSDYFLEVKPLRSIPIKYPNKPIPTRHQYSLWWRTSKKSSKWLLMYIIIPILVTLIAGYLVSLFGWNK